MELADLSRYFWDVDITTLDPARHRTYIIERLLEFGDEEATAWLLEQFSRSDILAVVNESRRLSPKSANYWKLMLAGTNASV